MAFPALHHINHKPATACKDSIQAPLQSVNTVAHARECAILFVTICAALRRLSSGTLGTQRTVSPIITHFSFTFFYSLRFLFFYPIYCSTVPIRGKSIGITGLQPGTVAWNSTGTVDLPFRAPGSRSAPVYPVQLPPSSALTGSPPFFDQLPS